MTPSASPHAPEVRPWIYLGAILAMVVLTALADDHVLGWRGSVHLHTLMEALATVLALMVGLMSLAQYAALRAPLFLYLAVAFLGTALLDGYHAVITAEPMIGRLPPAHERLVPWSWLASRIYLALWMVAAVRALRRNAEGATTDRPLLWRVLVLALFAVTAVMLLFALAQTLPPAMQVGVIGRPQEWGPGVLLAFAAWGLWRSRVWREDDFTHWWMLSLLVGAGLQFGPMALSHALHDTEFNVAHLLKKVSYVLVLTGLLVSLYRAYTRQRLAAHERATLVQALERANQELRDQRQWWRTVADHTADWETWIAPNGQMLYCSPNCLALTGYPAEDFLSGRRTMVDLLDPGEPVALVHHFQHPDEAPWHSVDMRLVRADGSTVWVNHACRPVYDEHGRFLGRRASNRDITQRKSDELRLRTLQGAIEHLPAGVVITDAQTRILYVNPHLVLMTGYAPEELIGQTPRVWRSGQHATDFYRAMWQTLAAHVTWRGEICNRRKDGRLYWEYLQVSPIVDVDGKVVAYAAIKQDITDQHNEREALYQQATHDPLTGLPNRRHFEELLDAALARQPRSDQPLGLLLIDLDHFKEVNDTLGHPVGDEVLREAARRMQAAVRDGDTVARLGGDEFAVLLDRTGDLASVDEVAQRLRLALGAFYQAVGPQPQVTASIGGALLVPGEQASRHQWTKRADEALYAAKQAGRNCVIIHCDRC